MSNDKMAKEGEGQAEGSLSNNETPISQETTVAVDAGTQIVMTAGDVIVTVDNKRPAAAATVEIADDQYFMAVALISAHRSKDPNTQVGACIVMNERIVGIGYNGMPDRGIENNDDKFPWGRLSKDMTETKYLYVCHAEMNAIVNKICADIQGSTLYTTLYPCKECSKLMIQFGIKKIVYLDDKYRNTEETKESKTLLETYNIVTEQYTRKKNLKGRFQALSGL